MSTTSTAAAGLDSLRRVELLRAELDRSLKVAAAEALENSGGKLAPLCVLFQSADAAHIQISGPDRLFTTADLRPPASPLSRFTVSPTPNAVPAMTEGARRPLHVLTNGAQCKPPIPGNPTEKVSSASIPTALTTELGVPPVSASSPASSVDSGVASPGAGGSDLMLFPPFQQVSPPATFPPWATVPRTRRWVFNFGANANNGGSLIDALALPSNATKASGAENRSFAADPPPEPLLTLQKPPVGKKYGPNTDERQTSQSSATTTATATSQPATNTSSNGYHTSVVATTTTNLVSQSSSSASSSSSSSTTIITAAAANLGKSPVPPTAMQRQLSEGCAPLEDAVLNGLPPRAATMPPLKSILKKPRTTDNTNGCGGEHAMDLPRNHQRRQPTRIVLNRSVSESLLDRTVPDDQFSALQSSAVAVFNATILNKLSLPSPPLDAFDEQLEEQHVKEEMERERQLLKQLQQQEQQTFSDGTSTPSSCSSETIDSDGSMQPAPIAKKRVSFSEHVQARIYRSNSSILGQRRKNEKKSRHRTNRRCNSDGGQQTEEQEEDKQQYMGTQNATPFQNTTPSSALICRSRELPPPFAGSAASAGLPLLAQ